ncbi:MAG: response regulator receiver modulated diguanylate cyclase [Candidatus Nitrotoga sp. SPKER]|nr:MAG: response regulator receiver modulated diguanylate cyclase [Candidatus Nitrotoga sp. SPKER]
MFVETERATILLVDDVPANLSLLSSILREDYRIQLATSGAKALELVATSLPDLILLDVMMPEMDGYEVCKRLKANPDTCDIPVLFVTARNQTEDEELGLTLGAMDYIHKPISPPIIKARVRNHIALKLQTDALKRLSFIDGLTQVANRRRFDDMLSNELRRAARQKHELSLLMLDVDYFKLFNDHYGHGLGDQCLTRVAQAMQAEINRPMDLIARYGGEEFVVLLPETDLEDARKMAESLRKTVAAMQISHAHSLAASHITISIGVACNTQSETNSAAELLKLADQALYLAKQSGRNQVKSWHNKKPISRNV